MKKKIFFLSLSLICSSLLKAYDVQERLHLGIKHQNVYEVRKALNDGATVDQETLRLSLSHVENIGKRSLGASAFGGIATAAGSIFAYSNFKALYTDYTTLKKNFDWIVEVCNRKPSENAKENAKENEYGILDDEAAGISCAVRNKKNQKGLALVGSQCPDPEKLNSDRAKRKSVYDGSKRYGYDFSNKSVTGEQLLSARVALADPGDEAKTSLNSSLLYDATFKKNLFYGTIASVAALTGLAALCNARARYQKSLTIAHMVLSQPGVKVDDEMLHRYEGVLTRVMSA